MDEQPINQSSSKTSKSGKKRNISAKISMSKKVSESVQASSYEELEPLPAPAIFRKKALVTQAYRELRISISSFVESLLPDGSWKETRIPEPGDLVPFFRTYARACFDAEAQERIKFAERIGQVRAMLSRLRHRIVEQLAADGGTWESVVNRTLKQANFGSRVTPYGEYGREVFRRPRRLRDELKADLEVQSKLWEREFWDARAKASPTVAEADAAAPKRSKFLASVRSQINKARGERTMAEFARSIGTNATVLYRLAHGELRGSEERLQSIAQALHCAPKDLYRKEFDPSRRGDSTSPVK
jgi:hypothetical protein